MKALLLRLVRRIGRTVLSICWRWGVIKGTWKQINCSRIRSALQNKNNVVMTGQALRKWALVDAGLRGDFPEHILKSNMRKWMVRPVDTWMREQELERLMDEYHFTFETMLVVSNPYGLTPLCAVVLFETETDCYVRYTVRGKVPSCDFTYTTERFVSRHRVPVFGLYAAGQNPVNMELLDADGKVLAERQFNVPGKKIPEKMVTMAESFHKNEDTAMPFVFITGGYYGSTYVFDHQGDIRYYLSRVPRQYGVYPMPDGRFLFTDRNINRPTYYNAHAVVLHDMDYLGRVRETYYVKEGIHHWAEPVPGTGGRTILGSTSSLTEQSMESTMIEYDRTGGETVAMLNLARLFPDQFQNTLDWAHLNSVYCLDDRYLILSLRNVSTVVKLDRKEERIVWLIAHPDFYKDSELEEKVLRPVGDDFHYFFQQHAVQKVDTGLTGGSRIELMLFDNHSNTKWKNPWFDGKKESYACFYCIDEEKFTVETTKVFPCALSPTRSNVYFDKERRRAFGMAGAANAVEGQGRAMVYEWEFDSGREVSRYAVEDGYFRAYPWDVRGGGMEECLQVSRDYRKGSLEPPVKYQGGEFTAGKKYRHMNNAMKLDMDFCYMDDLICIRAMDHKVEKVYLQGPETWEKDFTDTEQRMEKFSRFYFYVAVTTENIPAGKYRIFMRYDGQIYDTKKYVVTGNHS